MACLRLLQPRLRQRHRSTVSSSSVTADRPAAAAGLKLLASGGDFADGVIAFGGRQLGSQQLATFDRDAANLLSEAGEPVHLLR